MYLLLDEHKRVKEIIPDINPIFPGIDIHELYPADFVSKLVHVSDDIEVFSGYTLNEDTGKWEYSELPADDNSESLPAKSSEERIAELEAQITELQLALVELYESTLTGTEEDGK